MKFEFHTITNIVYNCTERLVDDIDRYADSNNNKNKYSQAGYLKKIT